MAGLLFLNSINTNGLMVEISGVIIGVGHDVVVVISVIGIGVVVVAAASVTAVVVAIAIVSVLGVVYLAFHSMEVMV